MTDKEIIRNRFIEIINKYGYIPSDANEFMTSNFGIIYKKPGVVDKYIMITNENCVQVRGRFDREDIFDSGVLAVDYEELDLLLNIYEKSYL